MAWARRSRRATPVLTGPCVGGGGVSCPNHSSMHSRFTPSALASRAGYRPAARREPRRREPARRARHLQEDAGRRPVAAAAPTLAADLAAADTASGAASIMRDASVE